MLLKLLHGARGVNFTDGGPDSEDRPLGAGLYLLVAHSAQADEVALGATNGCARVLFRVLVRENSVTRFSSCREGSYLFDARAETAYTTINCGLQGCCLIIIVTRRNSPAIRSSR